MIYLSLICALFVGLMIYLPCSALAEMVIVTNQRPIRCGMNCVVETKGFTIQSEAEALANIRHGKVYRLSGSDLWFVDYQVTEEEAFKTESEDI